MRVSSSVVGAEPGASVGAEPAGLCGACLRAEIRDLDPARAERQPRGQRADRGQLITDYHPAMDARLIDDLGQG